jgi:hypothetical protein
MILSIYLIHMAALGLGVYSTSNRNDYQKETIMYLGGKAAAGASGSQPYRHL